MLTILFRVLFTAVNLICLCGLTAALTTIVIDDCGCGKTSTGGSSALQYLSGFLGQITTLADSTDCSTAQGFLSGSSALLQNPGIALGAALDNRHMVYSSSPSYLECRNFPAEGSYFACNGGEGSDASVTVDDDYLGDLCYNDDGDCLPRMNSYIVACLGSFSMSTTPPPSTSSSLVRQTSSTITTTDSTSISTISSSSDPLKPTSTGTAAACDRQAVFGALCQSFAQYSTYASPLCGLPSAGELVPLIGAIGGSVIDIITGDDFLTSIEVVSAQTVVAGAVTSLNNALLEADALVGLAGGRASFAGIGVLIPGYATFCTASTLVTLASAVCLNVQLRHLEATIFGECSPNARRRRRLAMPVAPSLTKRRSNPCQQLLSQIPREIYAASDYFSGLRSRCNQRAFLARSLSSGDYSKFDSACSSLETDSINTTIASLAILCTVRTDLAVIATYCAASETGPSQSQGPSQKARNIARDNNSQLARKIW